MTGFRLQSVLAALDGSSRARGVFGAAVALARQFDAKLYVFRALVIPPEFPAAAANSRGDRLPQLMMDKAIEELLEITAAEPSYPVEPVIEPGSQPWRAILAVANRLAVDLVVLGSHGYGGLDRMLGTTAGKVVNNANRNVLIVHRDT